MTASLCSSCKENSQILQQDSDLQEYLYMSNDQNCSLIMQHDNMIIKSTPIESGENIIRFCLLNELKPVDDSQA